MIYCEIYDVDVDSCMYEPCDRCQKLSTFSSLQSTLEAGGKDMTRHDASRKYHKEKGKRKWQKKK